MNELSRITTGNFVRRGEGPDPVDVRIGKKLRAVRMERGMSQGKLGESIGVSFQQVQKYEFGKNRISCSRLDHIAKALDLPHSFFFEDD